jgi:signal transduction histidine kinase/ActR/RegA family two-component response regulator
MRAKIVGRNAMSAADSITVKDLARGDGSLETRLFMNASFLRSIGQTALSGIAVSFFIGWWALAWFVVVGGLSIFNGRTRDMPAGIAGVVAILTVSSLFVAPGAVAWVVGGPEASFIVATMLGVSAMVGNTLFASSRVHYWANLGPPLATAIVVSFFAFDQLSTVIVTLLCVGQTVLCMMSARDNRNDMLNEVLRIQAEMEAARKESLAKSQFLATMSHELRTPLNAVIGYAEILEEELTEDDRKDNATDAARISRSARNLLSLINEILDFSKIEAGRMEMNVGDVDVDALIGEVVQTVRHITQEHGTAVNIEIASDACVVASDEQRLRQCLLNLVSNAAKFTEGGAITIRADMERDSGDALLRIAVQDTGCGISTDDAERLFQPFTQVDGSLTRRKDGTGLGLVITQRLSELMGGDVSFVSALGEGSTFTLRVRDHGGAQAMPAGEGPLVLVIEDEASARDLSRRMLAHLPLSVAEARTGAEGLSMARARTPNLIVLDIHLPDRMGWDVLAELKGDEALAHVPVLVLSADDDRARAMRLGACEYLMKPAEKEQLAAAVLRFGLMAGAALPESAQAERTAAA